MNAISHKIPPAKQTLAFISDIHGNAPALRAVIAELRETGVQQIFAAGDLFLSSTKPSAPREVWQILSDAHVHCTRGLSDTALVSIESAGLSPKDDAERERIEEFVRTKSELGELILERVRRLPLQLRLPMIDGREIMMTHGSPGDATVAMTHDMSDEELLACIADDPADIVICGASHVVFQRQLEELLIVNVGSVGDSPEGNNAHFTVIEPRMSGSLIDQRWVEY